MRVFVERAGAANPDFSLDETNARAVAELCFRLDGIPLAVELAAARTLADSPEQMLERLGRTLDVVCGRRTVIATLDSSHRLLAPEERVLFQRLAVFARSRPRLARSRKRASSSSTCPHPALDDQ